MTKETFKKALENKNIMVTKKMLDQFEKYMQLLLEWNQKMNLTAITIERGNLGKTFFMIQLFHLRIYHIKHFVMLDRESGFPGIPLKIVFPDMELINQLNLYQKRCRF